MIEKESLSLKEVEQMDLIGAEGKNLLRHARGYGQVNGYLTGLTLHLEVICDTPKKYAQNLKAFLESRGYLFKVSNKSDGKKIFEFTLKDTGVAVAKGVKIDIK